MSAQFAVERFGEYVSDSDNRPIESAEEYTHFLHFNFRHKGATGDNRGLYMRFELAGGGGGECARFRTLVTSAVETAHGAHVTGELGTGGSISGLLAGLRATLASVSGLTVSGGTLCALRLDSFLESSIAGATKAGYLGFFDVGTYKAPNFAFFDSSVDNGGGTNHMLCYESNGMTLNCLGGLRIVTADGTFYIPYGTLTS